MRKLMTTVVLLALAGCERGLPQLIFGKDSEPSPVITYGGTVAVACCHDDFGNYPPTVPDSHVSFCKSIYKATRDNQRTGYIAMSVGCTLSSYLGHEYY